MERLSKNENGSMDILRKICSKFDFDVADIMEITQK